MEPPLWARQCARCGYHGQLRSRPEREGTSGDWSGKAAVPWGSGGGAFPTEGTADARCGRWGHMCCVCRTERRAIVSAGEREGAAGDEAGSWEGYGSCSRCDSSHRGFGRGQWPEFCGERPLGLVCGEQMAAGVGGERKPSGGAETRALPLSLSSFLPSSLPSSLHALLGPSS